MAYGVEIYDAAGDLKVALDSNLIAIANVTTNITVQPNNGTFQINVANLNNSGNWYVFLDGSLINASDEPIYTSVYNPTITYNTGNFVLTNANTAFRWRGTAYTYRAA